MVTITLIVKGEQEIAAGATAVIDVDEFTIKLVALTVPNLTERTLVKFVPVIFTLLPPWMPPPLGLKDVIVGATNGAEVETRVSSGEITEMSLGLDQPDISLYPTERIRASSLAKASSQTRNIFPAPSRMSWGEKANSSGSEMVSGIVQSVVDGYFEVCIICFSPREASQAANIFPLRSARIVGLLARVFSSERFLISDQDFLF